jgi:hypothetical protein
LAQVYLHQHGQTYDQSRLKVAIKELSRTPTGSRELRRYARELRDEAFVPWLVSIVKPPDPDRLRRASEPSDAHELLTRITFRRDLSSPRAWRAWLAKEGKLGQRAWMRKAMERLLRLLAKDPKAGKAFLEKAVYEWNDSRFVVHVPRLIKHRSLHNDLVGWINLTAMTNPYWRKKLRPFARKIIAQSGKHLKDWARRLLQELGYLPDPDPETWEQRARRHRV